MFEHYQFAIIISSTIIGALMAVIVNTLRMKTAERPINTKKIIIPPLMMSTGLFMFTIPIFWISWLQALEAFGVGILFSILLIRTTHFKVDGNKIYLIPSKAFIYILFGLLIIRMLGKAILGQAIAFGEITSMFFLLAYGMLLTWRLTMLYKYKQLLKERE